MAENEKEAYLQSLRQRAMELLRDAENVANSRSTRLAACFDSIYLALLAATQLAGNYREVGQTAHPAAHVIVAGATVLGLDDEGTGEVLELREAVTELRYEPAAWPGNVLQMLALARHVAELWRAGGWETTS
jgi:hypothetical protein